MYCDKCGRELDDDAKFCDYCGAVIEKPTKQTVKEKSVQTSRVKNILIIILLGFGALVGLYFSYVMQDNTEISKIENLLINDTYESIYEDQEAKIIHTCYWISTKDDSILSFSLRDYGDETYERYGLTVDESGFINKFLWEINDNRELELTKNIVNQTGIITTFTFSKENEENTWYYDSKEKKLRVGVNEYKSVSDIPDESSDSDDNKKLSKVMNDIKSKERFFGNCLLDESYTLDSYKSNDDTYYMNFCSYWIAKDGDNLLTFIQAQEENDTICKYGGALFKSGCRSRFYWDINERNELILETNIINEFATLKKTYKFSNEKSVATWCYDFENKELRIGSYEYQAVKKEDIKEIENGSFSFSTEISGIPIADTDIMSRQLINYTTSLCLFDETFCYRYSDSDSIISYCYWITDSRDSLLSFNVREKYSDEGQKIRDDSKKNGGYLSSEKSNKFNWDVDDNNTLTIKPHDNSKPVKYTYSSIEDDDTWYYDFEAHILRIGNNKYSSVTDDDYHVSKKNYTRVIDAKTYYLVDTTMDISGITIPTDR